MFILLLTFNYNDIITMYKRSYCTDSALGGIYIYMYSSGSTEVDPGQFIIRNRES